jgi:hypothetical protein
MDTNLYEAHYDGYTRGEHWYTVIGPGTHISIPGEHRGKAAAAALNNAYLLGRLHYLESKAVSEGPASEENQND